MWFMIYIPHPMVRSKIGKTEEIPTKIIEQCTIAPEFMIIIRCNRVSLAVEPVLWMGIDPSTRSIVVAQFKDHAATILDNRPEGFI
jgi:hypothetical protein